MGRDVFKRITFALGQLLAVRLEQAAAVADLCDMFDAIDGCRWPRARLRAATAMQHVVAADDATLLAYSVLESAGMPLAGPMVTSLAATEAEVVS